MKRRAGLLVVLFLFLAATGCATTSGPDYIADNLPRNWDGEFAWRTGGEVPHVVNITITDVTVSPDGDVVALGSGAYRAGKAVANIDVKWVIDPETLRFEMFESDPVGREEIVTDGSHVGSISDTLDAINAVWTTKSSGRTGDLLLHKKQ
jgi:hypothetical protein